MPSGFRLEKICVDDVCENPCARIQPHLMVCDCPAIDPDTGFASEDRCQLCCYDFNIVRGAFGNQGIAFYAPGFLLFCSRRRRKRKGRRVPGESTLRVSRTVSVRTACRKDGFDEPHPNMTQEGLPGEFKVFRTHRGRSAGLWATVGTFRTKEDVGLAHNVNAI